MRSRGEKTCQCQQVAVLKDAEAILYSKTLKKVGVDGYRWEILYQCEQCGTHWLKTYPDSARGDGPIFLTKTADEAVIRHFQEGDSIGHTKI